MSPQDKEFWKKAYGTKAWDISSKREQYVREIFEASGLEVEPCGFEAESTDYNPESPDEKGKPDYKIKLPSGGHILLEVTGTHVTRVTEHDALWIRPDKFEWADNHSEEECWFAHVLDHKDLVRVGKLKDGARFKTIHPTIRGNRETYKELPVNAVNLFTIEKFIEKIKSNTLPSDS